MTTTSAPPEQALIDRALLQLATLIALDNAALADKPGAALMKLKTALYDYFSFWTDVHARRRRGDIRDGAPLSGADQRRRKQIWMALFDAIQPENERPL